MAPILVFTHDYKPAVGGIPEHSYRVALCLSRRNRRVIVVTRRYKGDERVDEGDPFETVRVPWVPVLGLVCYFVVVTFLVLTQHIRTVYCANCYPSGFVMRFVSFFLPVRFSVVIHGHEIVYSKRNLRQRLKRALRPIQMWAFINGANRIFAVSNFVANSAVAAGADSRKVVVIYNGVDIEEMDNAKIDRDLLHDLGIQSRRIILTIARFVHWKGIDMVIRALPRVIESVPDAVYVLVGYGEIQSELEDLCCRLAVRDRVVFATGMTRRQTLALLKSSDVFVLVSRVEGFGIVFLEAGACGKPVVGGRSGGIPDAIVDGVTGLLVDPNDPEEIAKAIIKILCDPELAKKLGKNGQERVRREFTWDKVVDRIVEAMQED